MATLKELILAQKSIAQSNQADAAPRPAVHNQQPAPPATQPTPQTNSKPSNPFAALAVTLKGGENVKHVQTTSDASIGVVTNGPAKVDEGAGSAQVGDAPATAEPVVEDVDLSDLAEEEDGSLSESETGTDVTAEAFNHPAMAESLAEETVDAFKANVKLLYDCFDAPELVGNALRNILRATRAHPEYCKILAPEDLGLMVRALRQNYGIVASSKAMGKQKTTERKKLQQKVDDLLGDLGNLNI